MVCSSCCTMCVVHVVQCVLFMFCEGMLLMLYKDELFMLYESVFFMLYNVCCSCSAKACY